MKLNPSEKNSALWRKLLEYFEQERATLRAKNDGPLDATTTAAVRGEIKRLSELIALDEDDPI